MKFGGTSVGSPQRMKSVVELIADGEQNLVVLSAMSGTTNSLLEIADYLYKQNQEGANAYITKLEDKYRQHIDQLYTTDEYRNQTWQLLHSIFDYIRSFTKGDFSVREEKIIVAQGEILSTNMMTNYLLEQGYNAVLLPALEFMRTNQDGEPDLKYIQEHASKQLALYPDKQIYITQGFICLDAEGEISNLQRGGSDYTASLLGGALSASEIQIWTDIDGMHNNDPRFVENTTPVELLPK